jgi:autotransporter-associated beta strand protein
VYVHGGLFGSPYEACTDIVTFLLCNDEFHVTPAPCSGNLQNLTIEVCWEDAVESESEILRFHCCQNITYLLSNSGCDCVTTLLYEGGGCTSNAAIVLGGDAIIDASGTGALVLTTTVVGGTPEKTLTLTGTNADENTIGLISGTGVSVVKDGTGLWRMTAASKGFGGTLTVKQGTLQVATAGAAGTTVALGDTAADSSGVAAFLLEQGVTASPSFDVAATAGEQAALIGGANTSGTATFASGEIRMDRDVTLVAATGGAVDFSSIWAGATTGSPATRNVTIGAPGYAGTAELFNNGTLETTGTVTIAAGDVVCGFDTVLAAGGGLFLQAGTSLRITKTTGGIASTTTVTAATATLTLEPEVGDPAVSVSLDDLVVTGTLTLDGSGSLTIASSLSGGGSIVVTSGTLTLDTASDMTGSVSANGGSVVVNDLVANPGSLVTSATLTSGSLTVAFSSDPSPGAEYVLLAGPTAQTYGSVTLTGTAATGTYNSSTSTLTID